MTAPLFARTLRRGYSACKGLLLGGGCALILDQVLKASMRHQVPPGTFRVVTSFFTLVHAWNPGISFGLLACRTPAQRFFLTAFTGLIILGLIAAYFRARLRHQRLGLTLIIAGALSNMLDRLVHGSVFDFISLHWRGWAFPAFNLADMLVSIGFLTLMCENFQWKALRFSKNTP